MLFHRSDHWRRSCESCESSKLSSINPLVLTTHHDLHCRRYAARSWASVFDHVCAHKSHSAIPLLGRVVEHVIHLETLRVFGSQLVQLGFEKNVVRIDICIQEGDAGQVKGVLQGSADDLL